jgi:Glycosyl transferase family 8
MTSDTTIYTCIESGRLEPEVVLMVRTLRAFGGRFANCPVLAIQPRAGPSIANSTARELDKLQVTTIRRPLHHRFDWLGFANKPSAAVIADELAKTRHVVWLDADMLVVKEPSALDAPQYEAHEVLACVEELGPVSSGPGDRFEPFWQAMAEGASVDIAPFTTAGPSAKRIRLHFNSGVFRFRRGSGFAQRYLELFDKLYALRIMPKDDPTMFLHEQIIFSIAAGSWQGGFVALDPLYNFHVEPMYEGLYPAEHYERAVLLHWHGSLRMDDFRDTFMQRLQTALPALAPIVQSSLPLEAPRAVLPRLHRALLSRIRQRREAAFMRGAIRL